MTVSGPLLTEDQIQDRFVPIVLGGEIFAYSLARCMHEAFGIKTIVLSAVNVQVTSSSRFVDYRIVPEMGEGDEAIVDLLSRMGRKLKAAGKVALVIGSADWHARLLSSHKDELSEWFAIPYNDFDLLDEITQKERFYELCEELGIDYPKTWTFDCRDPEATIDAASFTYPLIAKPSNSARYDLMAFPGKEKVYEVHGPEELLRVFDLLRSAGYDRELVVQDFIPGEDDAIRSLTTFSDASGEVRVVSGGRVIVQDHSPHLIGNPLCILSERVERIVEDAKRFCKRTGYRGFANFDIKFDERDGGYKFFEVNTRPGRNTYYMALGGANIARLLVDEYILCREIPYREAFDPFLYTCVPAQVIRKTVLDKDLRDEVLARYAAGEARYPYNHAHDTLKHKLLARATFYNQIKKFKRYVWDVRDASASAS
ncbi:MAG: hypothetical protein SOU51_01720 [Collinsella sp.]|nr:hypothetical protein [Collinsella sp.]